MASRTNITILAALASLAVSAPAAGAHTFSVTAPYPTGFAASNPAPDQAASDAATGRVQLRLQSTCADACLDARQRGIAGVAFSGRLNKNETLGTVRAALRIHSAAATKAGLPGTPGTHALNASVDVISGTAIVAGCNRVVMGGLMDPPTIENESVEVSCPFERPAGVRTLSFRSYVVGMIRSDDPGQLDKLDVDATVERITVEL